MKPSSKRGMINEKPHRLHLLVADTYAHGAGGVAPGTSGVGGAVTGSVQAVFVALSFSQ